MAKKLTITDYNEIIKASLEDGTFYKDSFTWYLEKYVLVFTERMMAVIFLIICVVASRLMYQLLQKEIASPKSMPIITMERDQTAYAPIVKKLVLDDVARSVDETMLRELLKNYLHYREDFDHQKGSIVEYNNQLNRIKNNSSVKVFLDYKKDMDPTNPESPMRFFGKNFRRENNIISFSFVRSTRDDWLSRLMFFLNPSTEISNKAIVIFEQAEITADKIKTTKYQAELTFNFNGIKKTQDNSTFVPMRFSVIDYVKKPISY